MYEHGWTVLHSRSVQVLENQTRWVSHNQPTAARLEPLQRRPVLNMTALGHHGHALTRFLLVPTNRRSPRISGLQFARAFVDLFHELIAAIRRPQ
jgi:hypothetical protein